MHRKGSPLTSGRAVLWRTIPFLFISPILTTFIPGYDVGIYLAILYTFLILLLVQYRNLTKQWASWRAKVPIMTAEEVSGWYANRLAQESNSEKPALSGDALDRAARKAFQTAVDVCMTRTWFQRKRGAADECVEKAAKGLPFSLWLLEKENPSPATKAKSGSDKTSDLFSPVWFSKIEQGLKTQQQLTQGLKEHSIFILFRHGKYDVSAN
jgi:hypothetical protein